MKNNKENKANITSAIQNKFESVMAVNYQNSTTPTQLAYVWGNYYKYIAP